MAKTALAVACHPDDIEFLMSGTLTLLKAAGYAIHYFNVANGSCGTNQYSREAIIAKRREEAMAACAMMGAVYHESLVDDLDVFYTKELTLKVGAVVRETAPEILLTHALTDYMEDHSNTARLAVTAAFCRGMTNFPVNPPRPVIDTEVTVYHALPYILRTPTRGGVSAELYVDVEETIERKKRFLACHVSQKDWLDVSQGQDSYLIGMAELCRKIGAMSGAFAFAEGWTRHDHVGFNASDANPLAVALSGKVRLNPDYGK